MSVGITKKVKVLRPYQARIIKNVLRDPGHLLVEQPTGSGKTLQVVALTGVLLETRYDRIIICAPQQQIEEGFTGGQGGLGYGLVRFPDSSNTIRVPDGLIVASREVSYGSRARIQGYLAMPQSHALACTHAALSTLDVSVLPADCSGVLLVVDEAHHAPAEGLGRFLDEFELRGGVLHYYTATPWRQDGKPVVRPEMRVIRRSLAQHMAEGWAPAHLSHELVLVGSPGAKVNAQQFYGESALPTSFEHDMVDKLVGKWRADGEPKTIIRVPPVRGGAHGLVRKIAEAFGAVGARVLDATGVGGERQRRFLGELAAERACDYHESRYEVVVGIQRVHEGTDWSHCSAVYSVGMPSNLAFAAQLAGRGLRKKGQDCPERHRETTRLVFFVPGSGSLGQLSLEHSKHALLTACFLANFEVAQEWLLVGEIGMGVGSLLASEGESRDFLAGVVAGGPEVAEAVAYIEWAKHQLKLNGVSSPTQGEVIGMAVSLARKTGSDLAEDQLVRAAVGLQLARRGKAGERARRAARAAAQRQAPDWERALAVQEDNKLRGLLAELFNQLREEFRDETLDDSLVLDLVGQQLHSLTGGKMAEMMERMQQAHPVLTHDVIGHWASRKRKNPVMETVQPYEERTKLPGTNLSWGMVQAALYQGDYGLPGGEHLYQVLAKHGHETDWAEVLKDGEKVSPVVSQQARYWVNDYVKQHGRLPPPTNERVADTNITWDQLKNQAGRVGPNYFEEAVGRYGHQWVEQYVEVNGRAPEPSDEVIPDTQTTWAELDRLIKRHSPIGEYKRKGLAGVAKQILEWRPELVKRHDLGLTRDELQRISKDSNGDSWLRVWIVPSPDGEFPKPTDELVPGTQVTWSDLEEAARKCMANYPFAKSLVKGKGLIDFYCMSGVGLVGKWVEATGIFPTEDSGEVPGHRGLNWADVYESRQRCGGPHHSLVNSWVASNLHTWVSRYVRAHGAAPARNSGPIPNSGGLTWSDVDNIIQQNHHEAFPHGLPKDRSRIGIDQLPYVASDLGERISEYKVVKRLQKGVADGR